MGSKKEIAKNNTFDAHNTEPNAGRFWPLFDLVSAVIALPFGFNSRQLLIW